MRPVPHPRGSGRARKRKIKMSQEQKDQLCREIDELKDIFEMAQRPGSECRAASVHKMFVDSSEYLKKKIQAQPA
jgi:hypothetical protein